jgi:hypothetical protein
VPDGEGYERACAAVQGILDRPDPGGPLPIKLVDAVLKAHEDAAADVAAADAAAIADLGEQLGEVVRDTWVEWAREQPDCKASWIVPWATLDAAQRDVDTRIGQAVANAVLAHLAAQKHRLIVVVDELILHERKTRAEMLAFHLAKVNELQNPW